MKQNVYKKPLKTLKYLGTALMNPYQAIGTDTWFIYFLSAFCITWLNFTPSYCSNYNQLMYLNYIVNVSIM